MEDSLLEEQHNKSATEVAIDEDESEASAVWEKHRSPTMVSGETAAGEVEMEVVEVAKCEFCGLTEECTTAYMARVRERHGGKWVCGLCGEAMEEEIERSGRRMSREEAMTQHASFLRKFRDAAASPVNPTKLLIAGLRRLLRRIFDSRRTLNGPHRQVEVAGSAYAGSGSCFSSTLARSTQSNLQD